MKRVTLTFLLLSLCIIFTSCGPPTCEYCDREITGKPHVGDSLVSGYQMYDYCNTTCGYYHMQQVNNFWK